MKYAAIIPKLDKIERWLSKTRILVTSLDDSIDTKKVISPILKKIEKIEEIVLPKNTTSNGLLNLVEAYNVLFITYKTYEHSILEKWTVERQAKELKNSLATVLSEEQLEKLPCKPRNFGSREGDAGGPYEVALNKVGNLYGFSRNTFRKKLKDAGFDSSHQELNKCFHRLLKKI